MDSDAWTVTIAAGALAVAAVGTWLSMRSAGKAQATADEALRLTKMQHDLTLKQEWRIEPDPVTPEQWSVGRPIVFMLHLIGDRPATDIEVTPHLDLRGATTSRFPTMLGNSSRGFEIHVTAEQFATAPSRRLPGMPGLVATVAWTDPNGVRQTEDVDMPAPPKREVRGPWVG